ncbi:MAG: hypothetical protein QGH76_06050, partial [Phycisphaerales bacterium]|nr:hypothetical protein [Phycisphaerales bacterium]
VCMDMVDQLKTGRWPAATAGSLASGVDVSWQEHRATMVLLDYPGEIFRRAFVEGGGDEQSDLLIDHVDHAAAVILLIDPCNVHMGEASEIVDDDYGMVQAVERIRRLPGGGDIPIAVALTKCDEHLGIVRDAGGARGFVEKYLPNVVRYGGRMRMFATAGVRTRLDAVGRPVPNTQHDPDGLIDVVKYCMKHVAPQLKAAQHQRAEAIRLGRQRDAEIKDRELARQMRRRWIVFWIGAAVACLVLVGVALLIRNRSLADDPPQEVPSQPPEPAVIEEVFPPIQGESLEPQAAADESPLPTTNLPRYPSPTQSPGLPP